MKKPLNILFALADDASHFGIYGHGFVKTPACDSLGEKGVLFENAFTNNPKCAPSRASILTGRYCWELKEACNHYSLFRKEFAVFPDILETNGYEIGFTGKGWGPGDHVAGGFTRNPAGISYHEKRLTPPQGTCISSCDYAENFRDFLQKRDINKPFFFWYGAMEPHRPYTYKTEGALAGKKTQDIDYIPAYLPDSEEVRLDLLDYAFEIEWFDRHLELMLEQLREIGELENTLIIATSDNGMAFPRVKGQMYEQDFHLPMTAWCPALKGGGRKIADLINFADIAPTLLEAAGVDISSNMSGKSFFDVFLTNESGQLKPERNITYFGRERHDLGREDDLGYPVRCVRDTQFLYIRNYAPQRYPAGNPETGFTNCDSSPTKELILAQHEKGEDFYYNLAFEKRPAEELYDIINDNECMHNLAQEPAFAQIKNDLHTKLEDFLKKTGDPRVFSKGDIFESYPYVGNDESSWKALKEGRFKKQNF